MTKKELTTAVDEHIALTHEALQTLWDNINQGQKKQLAKREDVKALLERYGVE